MILFFLSVHLQGLQSLKRSSIPTKAPRIFASALRDVKHDYKLGKLLAQVRSGTVQKAVHRQTGQAVAIKTIQKDKLLEPMDFKEVRREGEVLYHLTGHPGVMHLENIYEDADAVHLVMELCNGGELFDWYVSFGARQACTTDQIARFGDLQHPPANMLGGFPEYND